MTALALSKRVNIASHRVKPGNVVSVRERSRNMALVLEALGSSERDTPRGPFVCGTYCARS